MKWIVFVIGLLASFVSAKAAEAGLRLEGYAYPFPERVYRFRSQQQDLEMVYMDVAPATAPRGVVVLLHGKNFSGSYFGETAIALRDAGYRAVIPDQIGFGKSTKPAQYHYTFQQLARNTLELLRSIGVTRAQVLGHSMGGMLATRLALMAPDVTASLTLLNPLGLEDWQALGVPYMTVDQLYQQELDKTPEKIRSYQLESYYDGKWRAAYDPWVEQLASFNRSPEYPRMAWNQALTADMIFTQPVVHEFGALRMPVLLIIGQRDRTAIGKAAAPPDVRAKLGDYPALGRAAKRAIPRSELIEVEGVGHLPHVEAFARFMPPYRAFLDRQSATK
jgi:pimeloyl-ACP methyl ester carboxylesterase